MEFISDVLLAAGALGAGFYCLVLSRRLRKFMHLEKGVGGAIATLSTQVDEMSRALAEARRLAAESTRSLTGLTAQAGEAALRLEGILAAIDDLPPAERQAPPVAVHVAAPPGAAPSVEHPPADVPAPAETALGRRLRLVRRRGGRSAAEAA